MAGRSFSWDLKLFNIDENKNKKLKNYRFVETFQYGSLGSLFSEETKDEFYMFKIFKYTYLDKHILSKVDDFLRVDGVCITADKDKKGRICIYLKDI